MLIIGYIGPVSTMLKSDKPQEFGRTSEKVTSRLILKMQQFLQLIIDLSAAQNSSGCEKIPQAALREFRDHISR